MLFRDDIVLIVETQNRVNTKLEVWRQTLEVKMFKLSRTKTQYLECTFNVALDITNMKVGLATQTIPREKVFKYLDL